MAGGAQVNPLSHALPQEFSKDRRCVVGVGVALAPTAESWTDRNGCIGRIGEPRGEVELRRAHVLLSALVHPHRAVVCKPAEHIARVSVSGQTGTGKHQHAQR